MSKENSPLRKEVRSSTTAPNNANRNPNRSQTAVRRPSPAFRLDLKDLPGPEELAETLNRKLEYEKKQNVELQEQLYEYKQLEKKQESRSSRYNIREILTVLGAEECAECYNSRLEERRVIHQLKRQNRKLLTSFNELYQDFKNLREIREEDPEELREVIRTMKIQHASEISETIEQSQTKIDNLQDSYSKSTNNYRNLVNFYEKALRNIQSFLKERLPGVDMGISITQCTECLRKDELIENNRSQPKISNKSIHLIEKTVYPPQKYILELNALLTEIETLSTNLQPIARKKIEEMKQVILALEQEKPTQLASARNTRAQIHQSVIRIENALEDIQSPSPQLLLIKKQFLELPFLLKPLFDLTKLYEQEVPVLVPEYINFGSPVYEFLCEVSAETNGRLTVEAIQGILLHYNQVVSQLQLLTNST